MAEYPCRYYGCHPNDSEEIVYALRSHEPVAEARWHALLADLLGIPGQVIPPPADPDSWWFDEADEEVGRIDIGVSGSSAIVYQNVGYPGVDGSDPERFHLSSYERAFGAHAEVLALAEIIALFGSVDSHVDYYPDPWTAWSLQQAPPSRVVVADRRWKSPWDDAGRD